MENQKQKPGLPCNQDFAKGGQDFWKLKKL